MGNVKTRMDSPSMKQPSMINAIRIRTKIKYGFNWRLLTIRVSTTGIPLIVKNWPNNVAPITIKKILTVIRTVSSNEFFNFSQFSLFVIPAIRRDPTAPTPAASVGVNTPK